MITTGKLQFDDAESAEEYFEEQLFEIKQQLLQKPLLRATAKSRLKLLQELQELEAVLEIETEYIPFELPEFDGLTIMDAWTLYSAFFSKWKLRLFNAASVTETLDLVESGFELHKLYYSTIPNFETEEDPKVSGGDQLMIIQSGFEWCAANGIYDFHQLQKIAPDEIKNNELLQLLILELKRLSLRLQYV